MSEIKETKSEQVAKKNNIKSSKPKEDSSNVGEGAISSPGAVSKGGKKTSAVQQNSFGAISSARADAPKVDKPSTTKETEKVAIFSTKNVSWAGVGRIGKGYNIVTRSDANKWLTREHVREATPEEIAESFKG
jgi:hypothetical protein